MSDAKVCDRCGKTHSANLFTGKNWTLHYKSIHKPSTFIGARNRTFDLCNDCRRDLDAFLGVERGEEPKELMDDD